MSSAVCTKLASTSVLSLSVLLCGCATNLNLDAPLDEMTFEKAVPETDPPKPVEIVETPKILPLPGQLKPFPIKGAKEEKVPPEQAIAKANKAARMEPTRAGYINAIQVYPWTEGALYRLYASPERVSTIALQSGEELIDISAGDTVRWVVGDTSSGQGSTRRVHILIKPTLPDIQTNLVVLTDRRTYHLELVSTKQAYMASISWTYPADTLVAWQAAHLGLSHQRLCLLHRRERDSRGKLPASRRSRSPGALCLAPQAAPQPRYGGTGNRLGAPHRREADLAHPHCPRTWPRSD